LARRQAQGAAAAVLYSETADIFLDPVATYGSGLRSLYLALRRAEPGVVQPSVHHLVYFCSSSRRKLFRGGF
jgi:hypothetical protein